ncbi:OmpP1/FadL family transporter [Alcanivorax sp. IL2]|uniref:OmpP1/FadL family transporter n=1 Tax=Alcanivorax sp. IL2 TaxID=3396310 RepID=UPI0039C48053
MSVSFKGRAAVVAGGLLMQSVAMGSMGNIGTTYGVLPFDLATAQALSLFNSQTSATYYNPAYLAKDPRGELTAGFMHAEHELRANSLGGADAPVRKGDVIQDSPSQHVLIGMKTDLTSLTKYDHPLYLGLMLGVEKYGEEMLAFESQTSQQGQYFEYGREPLFLNLGGATQLWRGIDVGATARITLHAEADLAATTDLAGNTRYERLEVSAKPAIRPIFGINMDWGETFCAKGDDCWFNGLETALAYRGYSNTKTEVNANAVIPGVISSPGLMLAINTLDSYQPNILSGGLHYQSGRWRTGVSVEWQEWSALEEEFERDTIKDQTVNGDVGQLRFKDVVIPRLGAQYRLNDTFTFNGGLAFSESPLDSDASVDVNYLDSDKWIVGLGVAAEFKEPWLLAYPVRLDFGYQYQKLEAREFDIYDTQSAAYPQPSERVEAEGDVHVFSGSLTLKF